MSELACTVVRSDLTAFLDGEVAEERAVAIRAHLARCAGCQAEHDALNGAWEALDALPGLEPRAGLFAEVEAFAKSGGEPAAAAAPEGRLIQFPFAARVAGLAAAALFTAGLGFGIVHLLGPTKQVPGDGSIAVNPAPSKKAPTNPLDMGTAPKPEQPPAERAPKQRLPEQPLPERGTDEPEIPRVKVQDPSERAPERAPNQPEQAVASLDQEWTELGAEDQEVVENLDLLLALEEVDDLEVDEALDVLDDLTDEELGEG